MSFESLGGGTPTRFQFDMIQTAAGLLNLRQITLTLSRMETRWFIE